MTVNRNRRAHLRPDLVADPGWVWAHRHDPDLRLVDCGSVTTFWEPGPGGALEDYRRAHIPGALPLPVHNWLKDPGHVLDVLGPDGFARAMDDLGVSAATTVVAYDRVEGLFAARLWWVLAYYGHDRAMVLDGGLERWVHEGRPVESGAPAAVPAPERAFVPRARPALACGMDELLRRLGQPGLRLVDTRSREEFDGSDRAGNRRVGHPPGAVRVEWSDVLADDGSDGFRPAAEIDALLRRRGLAPGDEIVAYCQVGVRPALLVFVLTALGWPHARVYDASMAEWANRDDTPLTVADPPGDRRPAETCEETGVQP